MPRLLSLLLFIACIAFGFASPTVAQQPPQQPVTDDQVNAIAKQLYCPVCENIPLDVCGTQACAQWRDLIREKLEDGWSEQQIKDYFATQYGDRVLATPPARGLNWLVYIVPPIAFLGGFLLLIIAFRSWRSASTPFAAETTTTLTPSVNDDPYIARLEEELRHKK